MHPKQLTLAQVIEKLECMPRTRPTNPNESPWVVFDFGGFVPTEIHSWRGVYDLPAIDYGPIGQGLSVDQALEIFKLGLKQTYEGYKGGEYRYNGKEPLWVAHWSVAGHTCITDVTHEGFYVVLHTGFSQW